MYRCRWGHAKIFWVWGDFSGTWKKKPSAEKEVFCQQAPKCTLGNFRDLEIWLVPELFKAALCRNRPLMRVMLWFVCVMFPMWFLIWPLLLPVFMLKNSLLRVLPPLNFTPLVIKLHFSATLSVNKRIHSYMILSEQLVSSRFQYGASSFEMYNVCVMLTQVDGIL